MRQRNPIREGYKVTVANNNSLPLTLTFLTLLVLKATNLVDWSWWIITLPIWGGIALALAVFIVSVISHSLVALIMNLMNRR